MIILRDYQTEAVREVVALFRANKANLSSEAPADTYPAVMVVAPTGSGKTEIQRAVADVLARDGIHTVVLTHLEIVKDQLCERGLTARTVQSAFRAVEEAETLGFEPLEHLAKKLGLVRSSLDHPLAVIVDEAHFGFEQHTKLYAKTLSVFKSCPLFIGFTATPAEESKRILPYIFARGSSGDFLSSPFASDIVSSSYLTLGYQVGLFPGPRLVFGKNIISSLITCISFDLLFLLKNRHSNDRSSQHLMNQICTASPRKQVFDYVQKTIAMLPSARGASGARGYSFNQISVDQRISLILSAACLQLLRGAAKRTGELNSVISELNRLVVYFEGSEHENIVKLFSRLSPCGYSFKKKTNEQKQEEQLVAAFGIIKSEMPRSYRRGERLPPGASVHSVYRIGTGFDLPEVRTVVMADPVSESKTLYTQRMGRGSRLSPGKDAFHVVEVEYLSKLCQRRLKNEKGDGSAVSWRDYSSAYNAKDITRETFSGIGLIHQINIPGGRGAV